MAVACWIKLSEFVTLSDQWQQEAIPLSCFAAQGVNLAHLTVFEAAFDFTQGSGVFWMDNIRIGVGGTVQVGQRALHVVNDSSGALALHLADGSRWQAAATQAGSGQAQPAQGPQPAHPNRHLGFATGRLHGASHTAIERWHP